MPKAKLKLTSNEINKLKVAAFLTDSKLIKGQKFGETVVIEISTRNTSDLFELGKQFALLPADAELPAEAPAAEEKAPARPAKNGK